MCPGWLLLLQRCRSMLLRNITLHAKQQRHSLLRQSI
jgi:hypothetical protein